jgi:8-oxo-dGTP diphosphatase
MTVYLVRHASAGKRGSAPNDLERNLDARGLRQASAVATLLGDAGIKRLIASPAARCIQTLHPLACHLGLEIEIADALLEGQSVAPAVEMARALAVDGTTAALCSHRALIPGMIDELEREGVHIIGRRGWAKGSTWRLETRARDILSARYLG